MESGQGEEEGRAEVMGKGRRTVVDGGRIACYGGERERERGDENEMIASVR